MSSTKRTGWIVILLAVCYSGQPVARCADLAGIDSRLDQIEKQITKGQAITFKDFIAPVASVAVALLAIGASVRTTQLAAQLAKASKTKELLFQSVVTFKGRTQPRSAVLSAIKTFGSSIDDLRPFFLEFAVKQAEHLGAKGEDNDAERSNVGTILDVMESLRSDSKDNGRIKAAFIPGRGTQLSAALSRRVQSLP